MSDRRLLYAVALLIASIAVIHIASLQWYLYWQFVWLDVPVHFLGGVWIALFVIWVLGRIGRSPGLLEIVVWVALVGVAWELFELWGGIPMEDNFAFDTALDLLMDLIGACVGFAWARRLLRAEPIS